MTHHRKAEKKDEEAVQGGRRMKTNTQVIILDNYFLNNLIRNRLYHTFKSKVNVQYVICPLPLMKKSTKYMSLCCYFKMYNYSHGYKFLIANFSRLQKPKPTSD